MLSKADTKTQYEKEEIKKEISELCSKMFGLTKEETKIHNKNTDKLDKIHNKMIKNNAKMAEEIYKELLNSPDDRAKYYGAVRLLEMKKKRIKARLVLKKISKRNLNPSLSVAAEIVLDVFKKK